MFLELKQNIFDVIYTLKKDSIYLSFYKKVKKTTAALTTGQKIVLLYPQEYMPQGL